MKLLSSYIYILQLTHYLIVYKLYSMHNPVYQNKYYSQKQQNYSTIQHNFSIKLS